MLDATQAPNVAVPSVKLSEASECLLRNLRTRYPGAQRAAKEKWHLSNSDMVDLFYLTQDDMEAARRFVSKR